MSSSLTTLADLLDTGSRQRTYSGAIDHLTMTVPGMTRDQARQCVDRERGNITHAMRSLVRDRGLTFAEAAQTFGDMSSAERVALYRSLAPNRASTWRWHPTRGRLMEVEHHDWHDWRFVATGERVGEVASPEVSSV